ncbi:TauD/TfdA family dioxygenase [Hymenobacter lucidus]|uniref:TauD/TfdA family dioxygenase n=1 Tax=Hymenobacter lucidus TaxID=2880930 RepID=A0ABS8ANL9_9BACT|nr:TauD/TfdA family dioxygenase [Hymenobacter lucidus]MCB2407699.1 TauD/TfdA family dioxygenase [Hymenobacter lucidus]
MYILELSLEENEQLDALLRMLMEKYSLPCEEAFLLRVRAYAAQLPQRILHSLSEFKYRENHNGTLVLRGFHIDDSGIGETPAATSKEIDEGSARREGFMLMLLISQIGDAFGWSCQRDGALINNILPLKSHEKEQLSTGSMIDLDWHTEEAFHPFRADYLALMCLRNIEQIPTVIGSIQDINLDEETKKLLFEPRYLFQMDKNFENEHLKSTLPQSVLFGDATAPYVKIDPSFMQAVPGDEQAGEALRQITLEFKKSLYELVLQQGDVVFLDNYRVVHGRKAFPPRFDGTDRWLKRVNITSDLRKSRVLRQHHGSRVIVIN